MTTSSQPYSRIRSITLPASFLIHKKRIEEDFLENKKLIEKNLGNQVKFFCWPWGHRSKETIKILKELGVVGGKQLL